MKTVNINGLELGAGRPKICIPLTGKTKENLLLEASNAIACGADLVEWRIDWFDEVFDETALYETNKSMKEVLGALPLLITFRTKEEGGAKEIGICQYEALLTYICEHRMCHMIDVEALKDEGMIRRLVDKAKDYGIVTIGSNHDFYQTPEKEEIIRRLSLMKELGFDIFKIAVMPQKERDVLTLLDATLTMKERDEDCLLITMSMGKIGGISRMAGECFGSCLTFGTTGTASAPGQMEAKQLKNILELLKQD